MELMVEEYKQTEVGLIPVDWELKPIGSFVSISVGRDLKENNFSSYHDDKYCYPVYSNTVSNFGLYGFYDIAEYSGESLTIVGRGVGLGKAFQRTGGYGAIGRLLVIFPEKNVDANFLTEYINHKITIFSESGGIPQLTGLSIAKYRVPLPPTKAEQTAIATALSDADALISSLEKLIAKKRNIKQGAMQKLLEPKEGWEVKKLGEIAEVRDGTHQTPKYVDSGIPFYSVESVTNNNFTNTKFITEEEHNFLTRTFKIEKGDILMTRIGSIGDCKLIDWEVNASFYVSLALLKIKEGYSAKFITHYSKSSNFKKEVELNSLQSAIPRKINLGPISLVKLELPNLKEQTRIANILSDIDAEINALEAKLEKYRNVKLGMMQNLLTGKIRLV